MLSRVCGRSHHRSHFAAEGREGDFGQDCHRESRVSENVVAESVSAQQVSTKKVMVEKTAEEKMTIAKSTVANAAVEEVAAKTNYAYEHSMYQGR